MIFDFSRSLTNNMELIWGAGGIPELQLLRKKTKPDFQIYILD